MSTTVDTRVLEMQFDNKQFEKGTATSMSTLDKLKQKLNLLGASKGLENIGSAAKKVDFSGISNGIETVSARFSALQVMGVTALANITNSAVNAEKRIVSALTIDPVKSGFEEYETQINAVQTILANTQHQGTNLKMVNAALDELNTYADKTIYNFTEMTRNIGTFTAAGVELQTSVDSIKGIANLAAVSGSSSQQASTAMYQLSQALAAGRVSLMDWNSVVNAGMGGKVFQDALVRTSELLGTGAESAIAVYGSFRESLTKGEWLTTEVLTETLKQFAGAYSEADLISQGFTEEQANDIAKMAKTAEDAATKVKTFTQLWDTLKEAAQSGWSQTWRLIIGDFDEAKELFTSLSDTFGAIIGDSADRRNSFLNGALTSGWDKMVSKIEEAGVTSAQFEEKLSDIGEKAGYDISSLITKYGSLKEAFQEGAISSDVLNKSLAELSMQTTDLSKVTGELDYGAVGEEVAQVQKALQALGYDFSKFGMDGILGAETESAIKAFQEANGLKVTGIVDGATLGQLKETTGETKNLTKVCKSFIDEIDKVSGRELLLGSLKNALEGVLQVARVLRAAWIKVFPPMKSDQLYNILEGVNKFSETLIMSSESTAKLNRTFRGLFSIISLISKVAGGGLKIAFNILEQVLAAFDMDILDVTANIGDAIYNFNQWIEKNNLIKKGVELVIPAIIKMGKAIVGWVKSLAELPAVQNAIDKIVSIFTNAMDRVKDFIERLKELDHISLSGIINAFEDSFDLDGLFDGVGEDTIAGLIDGIKSGIDKAVSVVVEIGTNILNAIKGILGIHSPSTEMFTIGENIIQGLFNGIESGISGLIELVTGIASKFTEVFSDIDWTSVFAGGVIVGIIATANRLLSVMESFVSPLESLGDLFSSMEGVFTDFGKVLKAMTFEHKTEGIKNLAESLLMIAGAAAILTLCDVGKLWNAVGVIAVLATILVALAFATTKISKASVLIGRNAGGIKILSSGLISIATSLMLLAYTVKIIGSLSPDQAKQGFVGLAGLVIAIGAVFAAYGLLVKGKAAQNMDKAGIMLRKMAVTMLLLTVVCKLVGGLTPEEFATGTLFAGLFAAFIWALVTATKTAGKNIDKVGSMAVKLSIAMLLLVGVCKLAGSLSAEEMGKGAIFAVAFIGFVAALVAVTKVGNDQKFAKIGGMLLGISASMILMVGVCKLAGRLTPSDMVKGAIFATAFIGFVAALVAVTKIGNNQQIAKMSGTILAMSVAVGILAGVAILLGMINLPNLAKGIVAVGLLGGVMTAMIWATKGATDMKSSLIAMSVAIGIMAAAIIALSFIDPSKLVAPTLAMSMFMGMFALMTKATGAAQTSIGPLIVMTVAVGLFAGILYLLSGLPVESTLGVAASLSILLLSVSQSLKILSTVHALSAGALVGLGAMVVAVGLLGGILGVLQHFNVAPSIETAAALSILLIAMSTACVILSRVGAVAGGAIAGAAALDAVIVLIGGLAIGIGALMSKIPPGKIEEWKTGLTNFLDFIGILANGLGKAIGSFIGGALEGLSSSLVKLADDLSAFAMHLMPFITTIKLIDVDAVNSVTSLGKMMASLTGANILESITSFITGTSSMEKFGTQLMQFANAIIPFSNKLSEANIDESKIKAAANAGMLMTKLADSIPKTGGWTQSILGESDMAKFGAGIKSFGSAIVEFSNAITGAGGINEETIAAAAKGGELLAKLQSSIPKTGGWAQSILGESDMRSFGKGIEAFGSAIVGFSQTVSGEGALKEEAVSAAAKAGTLMSELQGSIPKSGGWAQAIMGASDLDTFGESIKAFGKAMTEFSSNVKVDESAVTAATNAGSAMAKLQKAIPEEHWLDGKVSLDEFGEKIKKFGEGISNYSESVTGIDTGKVSSSITAAQKIAKLAQDLNDLDSNGIDKFKVTELGKNIKSYSDSVSGLNAGGILSSISTIRELIDLMDRMAGLNASGVQSFGSAVTSLSHIDFGSMNDSLGDTVSKMSSVGANMAMSISSGFKSQQSVFTSAVFNMISSGLRSITSKANTFAQAGASLAAKLVAGWNSKVPMIKVSLTSTIGLAVSEIRAYWNSMYDAGEYLGDGLIAGIDSKKADVHDAGFELGQTAVKGEKDGQKSNSPSKLTIQAGKWLGEGLVIGMNKMGAKVYDAGYALGDSAAKNMSSAISKVSDFINSGMDTQPTIRPVVDLSDVRTGVNAIGNMLNIDPVVIGASANINAISSMMSTKNQNGQNQEVVSAIDKLRKELRNTGGNSYNINGITYDDGSNVSNAVSQLIRAIRIEGRA